jgi:4-carboxymuconolactone decarboxylase
MNLDRLPPIPKTSWTSSQKDCAYENIHGPRGALVEPFIPLLRSPEL